MGISAQYAGIGWKDFPLHAFSKQMVKSFHFESWLVYKDLTCSMLNRFMIKILRKSKDAATSLLEPVAA